MKFTLSGITIYGLITLTSAFVFNAPTIGTPTVVSTSVTQIENVHYSIIQ
jgi:hypothetical protein